MGSSIIDSIRQQVEDFKKKNPDYKFKCTEERDAKRKKAQERADLDTQFIYYVRRSHEELKEPCFLLTWRQWYVLFDKALPPHIKRRVDRAWCSLGIIINRSNMKILIEEYNLFFHGAFERDEMLKLSEQYAEDHPVDLDTNPDYYEDYFSVRSTKTPEKHILNSEKLDTYEATLYVNPHRGKLKSERRSLTREESDRMMQEFLARKNLENDKK